MAAVHSLSSKPSTTIPTLTELAGLPEPAGPQPIDGESLVPVLKNPDDPGQDHAYHCFPRGEALLGRAIRTARYRLVEWKEIGAPADSATYELYDYQEDPLETQNLADDRPEVVAELSAILARHPDASRPQR
jgi:iduronate 2-sulfatase